MITDSSFSGQTVVRKDTSSETGYPSIANYIKKIFLVSDNDAYNRLYEFDGQETLNRSLWKKGYKDVRIVPPFCNSHEEQNRHTNAISFVEKGDTVYRQPPAYNTIEFDYSKPLIVGKGHFNRNDSLINSPMDFTRHNNLPWKICRKCCSLFCFPNQFLLTTFSFNKDDERFLFQYMSELPSESTKPGYDPQNFLTVIANSFCIQIRQTKTAAEYPHL
jgi:hypothetical protein